jgi:hypothetical protein
MGLANARCQGAWADIGSGSLLSTASDLYLWARSVRNDQLFRRSALEYPYGWGRRKYFDRDAIEQSGIVNGFSSYLVAYLKDDVYIVLLSNVQNGVLTEAGKGVAGLVFGVTPGALPVAPASRSLSDAERSAWMGTFQNPTIATVRIDGDRGALQLRWCATCDPLYLTPTGARTAYDRQDGTSLSLHDDGNVWMQWPGGEPQEFKRVVPH